MLRHHLYPSFVIFVLLLPAAAQGEQLAERCNALLTPLCLSDQVKSRKPFQGPDFIVNEIDLTSGGQLAIYQGIGLAEQSDVTGITKQKSYGTGATGADVYVGSSSNGRYFDVHYRLAGMYGVVQIFGYLASAQEAQSVGKFIANIQICVRWPAPCVPSEPLIAAGKEVGSLR